MLSDFLDWLYDTEGPPVLYYVMFFLANLLIIFCVVWVLFVWIGREDLIPNWNLAIAIPEAIIVTWLALARDTGCPQCAKLHLFLRKEEKRVFVRQKTKRRFVQNYSTIPTERSWDTIITITYDIFRLTYRCKSCEYAWESEIAKKVSRKTIEYNHPSDTYRHLKGGD